MIRVIGEDELKSNNLNEYINTLLQRGYNIINDKQYHDLKFGDIGDIDDIITIYPGRCQTDKYTTIKIYADDMNRNELRDNVIISIICIENGDIPTSFKIIQQTYRDFKVGYKLLKGIRLHLDQSLYYEICDKSISYQKHYDNNKYSLNVEVDRYIRLLKRV